MAPPKEGSKAPAKAPAKKTTEKKKKKVSKAETYKIYIYKCVHERGAAVLLCRPLLLLRFASSTLCVVVNSCACLPTFTTTGVRAWSATMPSSHNPTRAALPPVPLLPVQGAQAGAP